MLLRIRNQDGSTIRHPVELDTVFDKNLLLQLFPQQEIHVADWSVSRDGKTKLTDFNSLQTVGSLRFKHGDIVYVHCRSRKEEKTESVLLEHSVDNILDKQSSLIPRPRDPKFCKHGEKGMCDYCSPIEPFDPEYLSKTKFMSFHCYLRQQKRNIDEPNYRVRTDCKTHAPYPLGICTKCQPSAITLQMQQFRMVDHVELESAGIVDDFISVWRGTSYQRFGYLYGRYEPYSNVPLGIKAVVSAIYEPPQDGSIDGLELLNDPNEETVEAVAKALGLERVGMIFTDLVQDQTAMSQVVCKRHKDSYSVSSLEVIFMARAQAKHPSISKYSSSGKFGSKFVTLIVSGDVDGNVAITEYQVSNSCVALVDADLIVASTNPGLVRVQESSKTRYVPEMFYKYHNEYNVMVSKPASPTFPVEYLLVTLTHGYCQDTVPLFLSNSFPRPNRTGVSSPPSLNDLKNLSFQTICDFHLLLFVASLGIIDSIHDLCSFVVRKDEGGFINWSANNHSWQTLLEIIRSSGSIHYAPADVHWVCSQCTFHNYSNRRDCEMCGMNKSD